MDRIWAMMAQRLWSGANHKRVSVSRGRYVSGGDIETAISRRGRKCQH